MILQYDSAPIIKITKPIALGDTNYWNVVLIIDNTLQGCWISLSKIKAKEKFNDLVAEFKAYEIHDYLALIEGGRIELRHPNILD